MLKPKKSVDNMQGYFVPLYEKDWDYKIDSNENNYGPSPKVIETLKNCDYKNISFYPFYGELSQKIADFNGFNIQNIKVTNGADEAIQGIVQTYLEQGETLLTVDASFDMPVVYTQIQAGNVIKVPFKEKWVFPIDEFLTQIDNPLVKIVYIATPNNPTGSSISKENVEKIIKKSQNKVVLIDETYANYSSISFKELAKEYDNVFVVKSFSKDFALAGMRLGYVISNEENIKNLKKVISPFSVNAFAMQAGIAALSDVEYFTNIRKEILESKEELKIFFEELGAKVYNSEANFLLIDFNDKAEFVYKKLQEKNITVKIFKKGSLLENHLRVTIPTKKGVEEIKKALKIKPSLVFDMDGVLIDAGSSYRVAIEKTFEKFSGKSITQKEIQDTKNLGGLNNDWDLTKFLLEKEGITVSYDDIVDAFQEFYWDDGKGLINNETPLFNTGLFEELSKDYNLSIFTGRLRAEAMFALEKFCVKDYFYPIITTDDIPHGMGKPNPLGLNIVKNMTMSSNYYYFGDTIDDVLAAKSAGYYPVGCLPPMDKSIELTQRLKDNGAKDVINSVNEIKKMLEQKNETMC